jgi:hypothetical protein
MDLQIIRVDDKGEESESVLLKATEDIENLEFYVLCDTTYLDDDHISNELRHMYWFPKRALSAGDFVRLYTGTGKNTKFENKAGTMTHVLYWDVGRTIWNKKEDIAVLLGLSGWQSKRT